MILEKLFSKMVDDLDFSVIYELLQKKEKIVRMPFGKHQGKPLKEVPKNYITWLLSNGAFDKPENNMLKEELVSLGII